jgi:hypothetical protein
MRFPDALDAIGRTVLELDAIRFTTCEKSHCVSIHERDLFQVHDYLVIFRCEESLQLGHVVHLNSTT